VIAYRSGHATPDKFDYSQSLYLRVRLSRRHLERERRDRRWVPRRRWPRIHVPPTVVGDTAGVHVAARGLGLIITAIQNPEGWPGGCGATVFDSRRDSKNPDALRRTNAPATTSTATAASLANTARVMALLETNSMTVRFGGLRAVDNVDFTVEKGQLVGLIGPTARARRPSSTASPASSHVGQHPVRRPRDLERPAHRRARRGLGRTWQSLELFEDLSIEENLQVAAQHSRSPASSPTSWCRSASGPTRTCSSRSTCSGSASSRSSCRRRSARANANS